MDFCWVTINVKNMERSIEFYRDLLGLSVTRRMKPMPETEIAFLGNGGTEVELIRNENNNECSYGKDISLGFSVASLDESVQELKRRGIGIHSGPFSPSPMIKFVYVLDPNGLRIQLIEKVKIGK